MKADNVNCLVCTGPGSFVIRDVIVRRDPTLYTGTGTGLKMVDCAYARVDHVTVSGFDINLHHNDGYFVHYHDLTLTNYFTNGLKIDNKGTLSTADVFFRDVSIKHARVDAAIGLLIECPNVQMNGLELEEWGALGIHVYDPVRLAEVSNIFLNNVQMIGGAARCGGGIKIDGATDVRVNNLVVENEAAGRAKFPDTDGIRVTGATAERVVFSGGAITYSSRNGIRIDGGARDATFDDLRIDRSGEQGVYVTATSASLFRNLRIGNSNIDGTLTATANAHIYMSGAQRQTIDGVYFANATTAYGISEANSAQLNRYANIQLADGVAFATAILGRTGAARKTNFHRPAAIYGAQTGEGLGPTGVISASLAAGATAADTAETILKSVATPAKALTGECAVRVRTWGSCAANANAKTIRLKLGTEILATNDVTTAPNGLVWEIDAVFGHRGAGADTGTKIGRMIVGAATQSLVGGPFTLVGAFSNATTIAVTGQNGTASANDIVCDGMTVEIMDNDA